MAEGSDLEVEHKMRTYLEALQERSGLDEGQEFRMKSPDQQNMMNGLGEVRTGRASAGLVRWRDEQCRTDGTTRKGRGKGNVEKGEHGGKGGVLEAKEHSRTQGR